MRVTPAEGAEGRTPSAREMHARRCFLLGIDNPKKVARLWAEEVARATSWVAGKKDRQQARERARQKARAAKVHTRRKA